ncbi:hypothetical protein HanPI659440_Chr05g0216101 [Helianthus annuus]|nr:hypothetical protein HanPI659440_Chr05g0216101 [Helianthus annuus]
MHLSRGTPGDHMSHVTREDMLDLVFRVVSCRPRWGFDYGFVTKMTKSAPRTEPEQWVLNRKFPEQTITNVRAYLKQLMFMNMDVFAWTHADMVGVPCDNRRTLSEDLPVC